jgi:hypothetical protein
MSGIESGVIFADERVAAVAKDGFHEVEIANEVARCKKADFEGLFLSKAIDFWHDDRTKKKRDPSAGFFLLVGEEG